MQHPHAVLLSLPSGLVSASHSSLVFSPLDPAASPSTATPHSALIRLVAFHPPHYLVSTGEDKLLVVSTLPSLATVSSRELNKRANALVVDGNGTILVGDKFGDVYTYPLLVPSTPAPPPASSTAAGAAKPEKALPILGHVSMLTTLLHVPETDEHSAYVVTGDRDEHVRVSRYPRGEIIEKFLWGSKRFIGALLQLSPTTSTSPLILSGGGDPTLQLFSLLSGALLARFPVEDLLLPYVVVAPHAPLAVVSKRGRKKGRGHREGAEAVVEVEAEADVEMEEADAAGGEAEEEQGAESQQKGPRSRKGPHAWKDGVTTGLAVIKFVEVPGRGVFILAAGSTAILFIPFSLLLPSSPAPSTPAATPSLLDLHHSILDISLSATDPETLFLSLDLSHPSPSSSSPSPSSPSSPSPDDLDLPIRRISLSPDNTLHLLPSSPELEEQLQASAVPVSATAPLPPISSTYPVLSFLVAAPEDPDLADDAGGDDSAAAAEPKGKKGKKRPLPASPNPGDVVETKFRVGRRAAGRRELQEKLKGAREGKVGADSTA